MEGLTHRHQLFAKLAIVVDLAIVGDPVPIAALHGLMPVFAEVEDGQSTVPKRKAGAGEDSLTVRTTMPDGRIHQGDLAPCFHGLGLGHDAAYATHIVVLS